MGLHVPSRPPPGRASFAVGVVGAGFSGSLLALHLLRLGPPGLRIFLIERAHGFGPGLAYATHDPQHLLNVRVGNMSAFPDQPRHLEQWLRDQGLGDAAHPSAFITRMTYGRYLSALVQAAISSPEGASRLVLVRDEAVAVERGGARLDLRLAMGRVLEVDVLVLASGNPPPSPPAVAGLSQLRPGAYAPDPWAADAFAALQEGAPVMILGTGLTMVDLALQIEAKSPGRPIFALSRRGLTPRSHDGSPPALTRPHDFEARSLSDLLRSVRRRAQVAGWRAAVDEVRFSVQRLWRTAREAERRRFLRHLRPWWDVHRHRMAPEVADRIARLRACGQIEVAAGRLLGVRPDGDGVVAVWRPRGETATKALRVARIINCTGPDAGTAALSQPLIRSLAEQGRAREDSLGLGLDVDMDGRLIGRDGRPDPSLWAVGPITRGAFWEITAVPDIRNQVAAVARQLSIDLTGAPPQAAASARNLG